jgi:hypothetical protein
VEKRRHDSAKPRQAKAEQTMLRILYTSPEGVREDQGEGDEEGQRNEVKQSKTKQKQKQNQAKAKAKPSKVKRSQVHLEYT